ncbi:hypothetical protein [Bathycoccus sp. RCC716 virus 1]|mgnify:FL=1|uniref:Uncharacterized protein n=1 Tax=Bathycoccus sp. RCC716 virus 1 TaxID=2530038 RepID=A0A7S6NXU5_9PHYC|nr:hypothetical protein [Bathycoccus sp. RCC716 virus 1]
MEILDLISSFTSLFPFMILENLGSISSVFYHLHRNEFTYKLVYISRHVDFLILGYKLKGTLEYMELLFNFLSMIIIYKATVRDKKYMDINILIGIIKGGYGMKRFHYIISLYFWFTAFIIHYETILGRYTDIAVNILLCPPQYLLKNNILAL